MSEYQDKTLSGENVKTDFNKDMTYGEYLSLEQVLTAQKPLSDEHDEQLFIIIHHVSELWMKLMIHELNSAIQDIGADDFRVAFKKLARVANAQQQIISSWDVLATLTPSDYLKFRDVLANASGFQSYQNRMMEYCLGYKTTHALKIYEKDPEIYGRLKRQLETPSIYDATIHAVHRAGFHIDKAVLERDVTKDYEANDSVKEAFRQIYLNSDEYFVLYELLEKLVDIEDRYSQWRFRHMKTVERIIGFKTGTGGSSGVNYLKRVIDKYFFKELWELRTEL
ncbi:MULTISPECIES: tryptophan 2,3-dioxygenase [Salinicoccus]|uniref:Tryptophan 2,3-dioxygenase n=2 Tax=Salinicoccus TaxID=45669 RepID=A0A285UKD9_9STAP|nr:MULTISPECIES: tryptophan 2,3-dioxygenase family protein [Salinicoccus]MCD2138364.1 tryptophan 2,3-dioxygenase family protein [Salinicoccus halitifaciens]SOC42384.1 tryptophan 2,3-dioxygenase [Salinicoccus kekensis]